MEFSFMQPPLSSVYFCLIFRVSSECSAFETLLRLSAKCKVNEAEARQNVLIKLRRNSEIITEERVCTLKFTLLLSSPLS
jgi:hypothetical protein